MWEVEVEEVQEAVTNVLYGKSKLKMELLEEVAEGVNVALTSDNEVLTVAGNISKREKDALLLKRYADGNFQLIGKMWLPDPVNPNAPSVFQEAAYFLLLDKRSEKKLNQQFQMLAAVGWTYSLDEMSTDPLPENAFNFGIGEAEGDPNPNEHLDVQQMFKEN